MMASSTEKQNKMILAVESSCDETAVAIVRNGREILSNEVISQIDMHTIYGGVVPEIASRKHIEVINGLADRALAEAGIGKSDIDAVAVTFAPGLIGALLVGLNFAKGLAFALDMPLIPVHHIRGHVAANYIAFPELEPPFLCLVASGGHTLILGVDGYTDYRIIGSTRDDAAGETFDKAARVLGIGYPGGKKLDMLAKDGDPTAYVLPRAKVEGYPYDMSFSGLKTSVINLVHNAEQKGTAIDLPGLAASFCRAVSDTVVGRVIEACKEFGYKKLAAAGGVAANSVIRCELEKGAKAAGVQIYLPPLQLCGDNAAMIGCQGYYEWQTGITSDLDLNAFATLGADYRTIPVI
jgi:N6-L-threonylcarbamoyladenine synthase